MVAKLHSLSGVPVDEATSRALVWSDRYFAKNTPSATSPKRAANGAKAKQTRKLIGPPQKVLKRFVKAGNRYQSPNCGPIAG